MEKTESEQNRRKIKNRRRRNEVILNNEEIDYYALIIVPPSMLVFSNGFFVSLFVTSFGTVVQAKAAGVQYQFGSV